MAHLNPSCRVSVHPDWVYSVAGWSHASVGGLLRKPQREADKNCSILTAQSWGVKGRHTKDHCVHFSHYVFEYGRYPNSGKYIVIWENDGNIWIAFFVSTTSRLWACITQISSSIYLHINKVKTLHVLEKMRWTSESWFSTLCCLIAIKHLPLLECVLPFL